MNFVRLSPGLESWRGLRVLVTGASSGIGTCLACAMAVRGADVALLARRADRLEEVAADCAKEGGRTLVLPADLTDPAAPRGAVDATIAEWGGIDVVVNNAGAPKRVDVRRLSTEDYAASLRVNFLGAVAVTLAVLPGMLERGSGRIVNVGSIAGRVAAPRESAYVASKFALAGWSDTIAVDLAGTGIHVHHVAPGVIDTPLWDAAGQEPSPYRGRRVAASDAAEAILAGIEKGRYEIVVPRTFAAVPRLRAVMGETFLAFTARFDRRTRRP